MDILNFIVNALTGIGTFWLALHTSRQFKKEGVFEIQNIEDIGDSEVRVTVLNNYSSDLKPSEIRIVVNSKYAICGNYIKGRLQAHMAKKNIFSFDFKCEKAPFDDTAESQQVKKLTPLIPNKNGSILSITLDKVPTLFKMTRKLKRKIKKFQIKCKKL